MNEVGEAIARPRATHASLWFAVAIVLVAANLRPAVVGVAPVLPEIQASAGLSASATGVLTALPVLCFGLLAPAAPHLARRFGIGHTPLGALVLICIGVRCPVERPLPRPVRRDGTGHWSARRSRSGTSCCPA